MTGPKQHVVGASNSDDVALLDRKQRLYLLPTMSFWRKHASGYLRAINVVSALGAMALAINLRSHLGAAGSIALAFCLPYLTLGICEKAVRVAGRRRRERAALGAAARAGGQALPAGDDPAPG
jgi:hypothetical protein